ncbi:hypothetical protein llg_30970 [Luteolibacter sp. LG18]|nr:hypothetical protein llg_30970 [Luteolibacter sp. LG18]
MAGVLVVGRAGAIEVANLRCEMRSEPLGVDVAAPRLSWEPASTVRGDVQSAYRILVASSGELLAQDAGDLWDSGKVASSQQHLVPYAGQPLASSRRVFWKVKVWDAGGAASAWSAGATWTMGQVSSGDWQAQWIMGLQRKSLGYHAQTTSGQNVTKWVQVDLGAAVPVSGVTLHPKWHQGTPGYGFPLRFKIQASNDPTFATATTVTDQTAADYANPGYLPVAFAASGAGFRYVRVTATKHYYNTPDNNYAFALGQLEVTGGGNNVALNAAVSSLDTIEAYGWGAAGLTDGAGFVGCDYGRRMRREFTVKPGLKRAVAHVCGLGQYELFVNGSKNGDDVLAPGWSAYTKTCLYETRDLTAQLREGANAVGLILGNGMYNIGDGYGRYVKFKQSFGPLRAIAQLRLEYADGSTEVIGSDTNWKTGPGAITFENVYAGEDYDARLEPAGWSEPGFASPRWTAAVATTGPGGTLKGLSCSAPAIGKIETLVPVSSRVISSTTTVYDLGQNASVMPSLKVSGPAGAAVRIIPTELLNGSGTVDRTSCTQDGVRPAWWQYTLKGAGTETWMPRFFYHGSRYFQVELIAGAGGGLPVVQELNGVVVHSTSPAIGSFTCSSALFNRIHDLVRWSQRSNLMSITTDCPHRERQGWLEQNQLNGAGLRYCFDFAPLFAKITNDISDSQWSSNGFVPNLAPEYFRTSNSLTDPYYNSPEWGSTFILGAWQQYLYSGDRSLFERFYPAMKAYVGYLGSTANGNSIIPTGLGDWYDVAQITAGPFSGVSSTSKPLTATATYYDDARVLAQVAALLGNTADAGYFTQLAATIRGGFNTTYFKAANTSYDTGSQTANAMPLALGMVEAANVAGVRNALVADVQSRNGALTCGEVGLGPVFRALNEAGRGDLVYAMNAKADTPGYAYQLARGATSLTERWDAANTTFSSQNHFMLGQVMEWFYHDVAGIQPDPSAPGFRKIVIQPVIGGDLTWADASYQSVSGMIASHWTRSGNDLTLDVTIPVGSAARVHVPVMGGKFSGIRIQESGTTIWENGSPAGNSPQVTFVANQTSGANSTVAWNVGSGSYHFSWNVRPAPAGLTAAASNRKVDLAWNAVAGGGTYTVKRATVSGGPYVAIASNLAGTTFQDQNVVNDTGYYYVVSVSTAGFESDDSLEAVATPRFVFNAGFESPAITTFAYNPAGASWTFTPSSATGGSGISANGSGFTAGNPAAPQGSQVAFIQKAGSVSQTLAGLVPGTVYTVSFAAANRGTSSYNGPQSWKVTIDGTTVADYPAGSVGTSYADFSATFTATAASQVLAFTGTQSANDRTVFIDRVAVTSSTPVVGKVADQTLGTGETSASLPFSITDDDTPAAALTVAASSSNPSVVAGGNLALGGSGVDRTVTFTAGGAGTATITLSVSDGTRTSVSTFEVAVLTPAQVWRWRNFGSPLNTGIAADDADPDQDGVSNLFERAFAGNPYVRESGLLPVLGQSAGPAAITYRKAKAAADLVFAVQESADLAAGNWIPAKGSSTVLSEDGAVQVIRFEGFPDGAMRRFLRVMVKSSE